MTFRPYQEEAERRLDEYLDEQDRPRPSDYADLVALMAEYAAQSWQEGYDEGYDTGVCEERWEG